MQRLFLAARLFAIFVFSVAGGIAGVAQSVPSAQTATAAPPNSLQIQMIKTGLFVISGGGANTIVRMSADGPVLVDGKLPENYAYLRARVHRINELPVRALILTNSDADHSGTNAKFLEAGAHLIANQNAGVSLAVNDLPRATGALPPIITFDREYALKIGGIEAQLMHYGPAHTDGDTVVYFPNLRVVAVGNLYAALPDPDYAKGGSLAGWGRFLVEVMKLDFDVAIPSAGAPISKADLIAFQARIDTLISRADRLIKDGVPKDQFMTQLKTEDLGWHFDFTPEQIDGLYAELAH